MKKILLIEDDIDISEMIAEFLISEDYIVYIYNNGKAALRNFEDKKYDLALIDLMLPDIGGMDIIKEIRKSSLIPIIIITAKNTDIDKIMGFNFGADDYITKPFSLVELLLRIKANIRRVSEYAEKKNTIIKINDLIINIDEHSVLQDEKFIELTYTEFELLKTLAANSKKSFTKEELYELVWKEDYFGDENIINTHINRLRNKLNQDNINKYNYIKTLWGIGYKWGKDNE